MRGRPHTASEGGHRVSPLTQIAETGWDLFSGYTAKSLIALLQVTNVPVTP